MSYLRNMNYIINDMLLGKLHALRGRVLCYQGESCTVIELLQDENALVLQYTGRRQQAIQANQFGEANRRTSAYHTLPLLIEHGVLNPVIAAWVGQA
ncbi:hypothetical protein MNBD_GAMMA13-1971 [hydrothermal vent metagenome]|uniref:Uncharacterized protein n=1 Tax=hydrothermal vent metagenome TaxID=652676 RepID=A0A3B0Z0A2_9ZZZZ